MSESLEEKSVFVCLKKSWLRSRRCPLIFPHRYDRTLNAFDTFRASQVTDCRWLKAKIFLADFFLFFASLGRVFLCIFVGFCFVNFVILQLLVFFSPISGWMSLWRGRKKSRHFACLSDTASEKKCYSVDVHRVALFLQIFESFMLLLWLIFMRQ